MSIGKMKILRTGLIVLLAVALIFTMTFNSKVIALEIDKDAIKILKRNLGACKNFILVEQDILIRAEDEPAQHLERVLVQAFHVEFD